MARLSEDLFLVILVMDVLFENDSEFFFVMWVPCINYVRSIF